MNQVTFDSVKLATKLADRDRACQRSAYDALLQVEPSPFSRPLSFRPELLMNVKNMNHSDAWER